MTGLAVRPARAEDAAGASRVLVASITRLCGADHHDDPATLARWLADKTPEALAGRIAAGGLRLAERGGAIVGVGEIDPAAGKITLTYVDPAARGQGVSSALLAAMEAELAAMGLREARLTATATARAFYLARGWAPAGPPRAGRWIVGHPLAKRLEA